MGMTNMIELKNGDCLELMNGIPDGSIDMLLCDLPYGTTACKWDSIIPFEPLWEQYNRIIKDNGAIVLFGSEPFSTMLRYSNLKMFKYDWYWRKPRDEPVFKVHILITLPWSGRVLLWLGMGRCIITENS